MVKDGYWEDVEFTKIGNREKHEVCGKIMSIVLDIVLFKKSVKHSYKNIQKKDKDLDGAQERHLTWRHSSESD